MQSASFRHVDADDGGGNAWVWRYVTIPRVIYTYVRVTQYLADSGCLRIPKAGQVQTENVRDTPLLHLPNSAHQVARTRCSADYTRKITHPLG